MIVGHDPPSCGVWGCTHILPEGPCTACTIYGYMDPERQTSLDQVEPKDSFPSGGLLQRSLGDQDDVLLNWLRAEAKPQTLAVCCTRHFPKA